MDIFACVLLQLGTLISFISKFAAKEVPEINNVPSDNSEVTHVYSESVSFVDETNRNHHLVNECNSESPLSAPSQAKVHKLHNSSILVNWNVVRDPRKKPQILYFIIEYRKSTQTKRPVARCKLWYKCTEEMPRFPYYYCVDGLDRGFNYRFRIGAVYGAGKNETLFGLPSHWVAIRRNTTFWKHIQKPIDPQNPHSLWLVQ